jgi:hypothetical protein
MANPRFVTSTFAVGNGDIVGVTTYQRDEQTFDGVWDIDVGSPLR